MNGLETNYEKWTYRGEKSAIGRLPADKGGTFYVKAV